MTSFDLEHFLRDHFELLGLPRTQALDTAELDRVYQEVQGRVHPDKHAHLGESERRLSMQWATRVNEAYVTLKSPLKRAQYLLHVNGVDPQIEHNTAMPVDFLMRQMEFREAVAEAQTAGDADELEHMLRRLRKEMAGQYADLVVCLDERQDYARAADIVRQLMFQEKLLHEIDEALQTVEV